MAAVAVEAPRALLRKGRRALPAALALWAIGCGIAAVWMIHEHQHDWMTPDERYGWEGWWTVWLPGLYAAGCLVIAWKVVSWPMRRLLRLARSSRAAA
jgi:hypothetical protein